MLRNAFSPIRIGKIVTSAATRIEIPMPPTIHSIRFFDETNVEGMSDVSAIK